MRRLVVLALGSLAVSPAGCDKPARIIFPPPPGAPPQRAGQAPAISPDVPDYIMDDIARKADDHPFPQDPAKAEQLRSAYRESYRKTTVGAFEKMRSASAPWVAQARAAMEARSVELSAFALTGIPDYAAQAESDEAVRAALAAGCDDPLILYWKYTLDTALGRVSRRKTLAEHRAVVRGLFDSRYPDVRKLHAVNNLLAAFDGAGRDNPFRYELLDWETRFWNLFDRVAAWKDPMTENDAITAAEAYTLDRADGRGMAARYAQVARHLSDAAAPAAVQLTVRGKFYISYAWEARGSGWAKDVTEEGNRLFWERLPQARKALEQAFDADPSGWQAPTEMMTVCMGMSLGRAEMEKWFSRAMAANPDNAEACMRKMNFLHPKWHGKQAEYQGFGWKCVRTGNSAGHLPAVALHYYQSESPVCGPEFHKNEREHRGWYATPIIWTTVRRGLEAQLAAKPQDRYYRSLLAKLACFAGQYEVARAQFDLLGDDYHPAAFADRAEYEAYRTEAQTGRAP